MINPTKDPVDVLIAARELIEDENRWSRKHKAETQGGRRCHPGDRNARKWDIEGAIGISDNNRGFIPIPLLYLIDRATRELYPIPVVYVDPDTHKPEEAVWEYGVYQTADYVNSWLGHQASLRVLDRAIEIAKGIKHGDSSK